MDAERGERHVAKALQDLVAVVPDVLQVVAGVAGQPAAVGVQVGEGDVVGHVGVVELQVGVRRVHRVVPGEDVPTDEPAERGGRDRLGQRGQLEDGVGVDGRGVADLAHSVSLGEHHLVAVDDRDGDTGHPRRRHLVGDHLVHLAVDHRGHACVRDHVAARRARRTAACRCAAGGLGRGSLRARGGGEHGHTEHGRGAEPAVPPENGSEGHDDPLSGGGPLRPPTSGARSVVSPMWPRDRIPKEGWADGACVLETRTS